MADSYMSEPFPLSSSSQPIPSDIQANIDLLISLAIHSWQALNLAIQNAWGGSPQLCRDKRDWLAGAISELLTSNPPQITHLDDLEEVLLQVMVDEFDVVVDDDSAFEVAQKIWKGRDKIVRGDVTELKAMYEKWVEAQKKFGDRGETVLAKRVEVDEDGQDTDWDEDDDEEREEEEEWNGFPDRVEDQEMGEAPPLVDSSTKKGKMVPEVDEDGFTMVVGKSKKKG